MACKEGERDSQGGNAPPLITRYAADSIRAGSVHQACHRMHECMRPVCVPK